MSKRVNLVMASLWAAATVLAAVLDAPSSFTSMLPIVAFVTLLPNARRCA